MLGTQRLVTAAAATACGLAAAANADVIDAVITADNHYAVFANGPAGISYVGGNETGAAGSEGRYNWSRPETWSFETVDTFYVAAWSDNSVAQGLLAQVFVNGADAMHTGHDAWEVYATGIDANTGMPHPTAAWISGHVATADQSQAWETPYVGGANGMTPWHTIAGITDDANWTWWDRPDQADPLRGGSGAGEILIFRVAVPTPGAMATLGLGLVTVGVRRRRRHG